MCHLNKIYVQFILEEKDIEQIHVSGITVQFIVDITA